MMKINFMLLLTVLLISCCNNTNDKEYFFESNKMALTDYYYWEIDSISSKTHKGYDLFKSDFLLQNFSFEGYVYFEGEVLFFCDNDVTADEFTCDAIFKFNSYLNKNIFQDENITVRLILHEGDKWFFIIESNPTDNYNVRWLYGFSKQKGLILEAQYLEKEKVFSRIIGEVEVFNNYKVDLEKVMNTNPY